MKNEAASNDKPMHPKRLLTKSEIREYFVPVGGRTLDRMIADGTFPPPDKSIGGKMRFWRVETVLRFNESSAGDTPAAA